jgi:hypothetical protein
MVTTLVLVWLVGQVPIGILVGRALRRRWDAADGGWSPQQVQPAPVRLRQRVQ